MEDDFFKQSMQDVKPLGARKKIRLSKQSNKPISMAERRFNALNEKAKEQEETLQEAPLDLVSVDPYEVIGMKKPGIQEGVYRKLRLGQYPIETRLDLHHHTIKQAREAVSMCIKQAMGMNIRSLLILSGKGARNKDNPALLKSHLVHWLKQLPEVHAFHTAQTKDGGAGAFYVLLRKSEKAKQANRERFNKGRI